MSDEFGMKMREFGPKFARHARFARRSSVLRPQIASKQQRDDSEKE